MTRPIRILGCPCRSLLGEEEAIQILDDFIKNETGGYTVAINAEKIMFYKSREEIRRVIDNALLPYPDGFGAVLALRLLHRIKAAKIDMPAAVLRGAAEKEWRVFLLGATDDVNRRAHDAIRSSYPSLKIVGRLDGFRPEEESIAAIESTEPQVVMAALGSPRQELFAARLSARAPATMVVGCGGALDIIAGDKKRAPEFMVHGGLEWLYRLWKEPMRWRRQLVLPVFAFRVLIEAIGQRLGTR